MKQVGTRLHNQYSTLIPDIKKGMVSESEQSILAMLDYFTTPGSHVVMIDNQAEARRLLTQFLDAIPLYTCIGMLSISGTEAYKPSPSVEVIDLYQALSKNNAFFNNDSFAETVAALSDRDLLIIEGSKELLLAPWFGRLQHELIEQRFTHMMPIITWLYKT